VTRNRIESRGAHATTLAERPGRRPVGWLRRLLDYVGAAPEPEAGLIETGGASATDPLKQSALYRLKRDSMFIVAKMNEGNGPPGLDAFKRQIVFVQSQLVLAAIRDPDLPVQTKAALVGFQEASLRETIEDRRGVKRRACLDVARRTSGATHA
jgi:hypothetical protein